MILCGLELESSARYRKVPQMTLCLLLSILKHKLDGLNYVLHLQKVPSEPQRVEYPFRDSMLVTSPK